MSDTYELCFMIFLLCFVKYIFIQYIEYTSIRSVT